MTKRDDGLPGALDGLTEEAPELARTALRLPELLDPATPPARGKKRLLAAVSELPLRYAPFFDRLAELWDVSPERVELELERARDAALWRYAALPGIRLYDVAGGPATEGARARLVRFAPGLRFPAHRHLGRERVLLLEGRYTDSDGTRYGSGDLHEMRAGTEHGFAVADDEPCIAAVVEEGREFRSRFLRVLSRIVKGD